jgi:hypothetical protein
MHEQVRGCLAEPVLRQKSVLAELVVFLGRANDIRVTGVQKDMPELYDWLGHVQVFAAAISVVGEAGFGFAPGRGTSVASRSSCRPVRHCRSTRACVHRGRCARRRD